MTAAPTLAAPVARRAPRPELRSALSRGYTGWLLTPDRSGTFVLPATTSVTLVLKLADSAHRPPEFVNGVQPSYTVIGGGCSPRYVEVALSPLGAYTLLGLPMNELAGRLVDLRDILGDEARRLGERLRDAPTWRQRFDAIDRFFLGRMDQAPRVAAEVALAWQRLAGSGGRVPIREISHEVGWSHKHLITRFTQLVGLTPKRAARVIRFERLLHAVDRGQSWSELATDFSYADQAHLTREFTEFTGTSPAAFRAARSG
jgi:AraC-like DNA-binding protein